MPKIPMYQGQVGVAAGPLSPRANASAFAAGGSALSQLGQAVTSAGKVAGQVEENKRKLEFQAQNLELQKERIKTDFAIARQNADAENFLTENLIASADELAALGRDPSITSIEKYELAYAPIQDKYLSNIDQLNVSAERKQKIKNRMLTSMNSTRMTGVQNAFNQGLQKQTESFNEYGNTLASEVNSGKVTIEVAEAEYAERYNDAVNNGLKPSVTPKSFGEELVRNSVFAVAADESNDYIDLEDERDRILDGDGRYGRFDDESRAALANILTNSIDVVRRQEITQLGEDVQIQVQTMANSTGDDFNTAYTTANILLQKMEDRGKDTTEMQIALDAAYNVKPLLEANTFTSPAERNAAIASARKAVQDSLGTEDLAANVSTLQQLQKGFDEAAKAAKEDPALYVSQRVAAQTGKPPTLTEILEKQRSMGFDDSDIKLLTNAQTSEFISSLGEAQTPQELVQVVNSLLPADGDKEKEALVMAQLRQNGFGLSYNLIAANPNSPMAQTFLNALQSEAVTGEMKPTKAKRQMIKAAVLSDPTIQSQLTSMGGQTMLGVTGTEVMASGSDTTDMSNMRTEVVNAIANLAQKLAVDDEQFFSGEGSISTPSEMQPYIEQAAAIFGEKYGYGELNGSVVRVPKHQEGNLSQITSGIALSVKELTPDEIYFESNLPEGSPEYEAAKKVYVEEVRQGFEAITINGDSSALVTDKAGGAVNVINEEGDVVPLIVSFDEMTSKVETSGQGKIKRMKLDAQAIAREIRAMKPSEKRTAEGQAKRNRLIAKREALIEQYNELSRYLVSIGAN